MPKAKAKKTRVRYVPMVELPPLSAEEYEGLTTSILVSGVLVPILVDCDGPIRRIIDGVHRKKIADKLKYDCPEVVVPNLTDEELRTMARALNLARRQLNTLQKRAIIADQLRETPERSARWIGKMLGVSGNTVTSVRIELEAGAQVEQLDKVIGPDGKCYSRIQQAYQPANKPLKAVDRSLAERKSRIEAVTLIHGDCCKELRKIASDSVDAIVTDPIYPEVSRDYGRISEDQWHSLMRKVVTESRRILKPKGSAVFIIQPNYEKIGKMRLWLWDFVAWAGREMGLIQDVFWWAIDALPLAGTNRKQGLLRQSVKMCVWLGPPDCYRNQDAVLWTPSDSLAAKRREDMARRISPSGRTYRNSTMTAASDQRGGTTPFNLLPLSNGGQSGSGCGHPAATPYELAFLVVSVHFAS